MSEAIMSGTVLASGTKRSAALDLPLVLAGSGGERGDALYPKKVFFP